MTSLALAERIATDLSELLRTAEDGIAEAVRNGDTDRLVEARAQADAHRLYEERAGADDRARLFAQIKLMAEAGLGALSFENYPTVSVSACPDGVKIGPHVISVVTAKRWRTLANAQERGVLGDVIRELHDAGHGLGTHVVADACGRRGVSGVPGAAISKLIQKEALNRGISVMELSARTGISTQALYRPGRVMYWFHAKTVADALGANPLGLPMAARERKVAKTGRLWLRRERKRTGGRWDETYSRFRRCLDEFSNVAPDTSAEWDPAYAHFYALEEIIGRAMKNDVLDSPVTVEEAKAA